MKNVMVAAAVIMLLGTCAALCLKNEARIGQLTNIDGIPYPVEDGTVVITERLAHADVHLRGPLLGKQLSLTVTFVPLTATELRVGIRENAFWLSYPWQTLYRRGSGAEARPVDESVTQTVVIPLTDKLPDRDGSLDLMFIQGSEITPHQNPVADATSWRIESISAEVSHAVPTASAMKDYIRRFAAREAPL